MSDAGNINNIINHCVCGVWRSFKYPSVTARTPQAMDENVPSSAPLPATPHFLSPIASFNLKLERDCVSTREDETDPLDADDSIVIKSKPERDFILTFESLPVLWDPSHPHYTNKYKRYELYLALLYKIRFIDLV